MSRIEKKILLFSKAPPEAGRARPGASRSPRARRRTPGPRGRFSGPEGPWDPSRRRAKKTGFTARRGRCRASLYRAPRGCAAYLSTEELAPAPPQRKSARPAVPALNEGLRAFGTAATDRGRPRRAARDAVAATHRGCPRTTPRNGRAASRPAPGTSTSRHHRPKSRATSARRWKRNRGPSGSH